MSGRNRVHGCGGAAVVGIVLVKNEDLYLRRAVLNVADFCDRIVAVENGSQDQTLAVLETLARELGGKIEVHRARHPSLSHELIQPLAGTRTWIFGVDGDEIYDPAGLARFRRRIDRGEFDRQWVVFGNVLNTRSLDLATNVAAGHLAPPCRSMTKLYNFAAIEAWHGPCQERLHGGRIVFKPGFHEGLRCDLHQTTGWEDAEFRCLHLCFLRRSSLEPHNPAPRKNIMDHHAWSLRRAAKEAIRRLQGKPATDWKEQRYGRGPLVSKPADCFFPSKPEAASS